MKAVRGSLLVKLVGGDNAWEEKLELECGTLYLAGEENVERNAKSEAIVYSSGVGGVKVGDRVGLDYRVFFDYHLVGDTKVYKNKIVDGGDVYWYVSGDLVLWVMRDGVMEGMNGYVMLEGVKADKIGFLIAIGASNRMTDDMKSGVGIVRSRAEGLDIGDEVYFNEKWRNEYKFGGKVYNVIHLDKLDYKR